MRAIFFSLVILSVSPSWADEQARADAYVQSVFETRVREVSEMTKGALNRCAKERHSVSAKNLARQFEESLFDPRGERALLNLIDLLKSAQSFQRTCTKQLTIAQKEQGERWIFFPAYYAAVAACADLNPVATVSCIKNVKRLWSDLDPHCYKVSHNEFNGTRETNACYAATGMLAKRLRRYDSDQNKASELLSRMYDYVSEAKPGTTVELLKFFDPIDLNSNSEREEFLLLLSGLMTSAPAGIGHVDDFGNNILNSALTENKTAESILKEYLAFKRKSDYRAQLLAWARAKKVKVAFSGEDVTKGGGHHVLISAYLGCIYRDKGVAFSGLLPLTLGLAYEAKDYISNRGAGQGPRVALREFLQDSLKYARGAEIGYKFCSNI